jgi:hypothetical protein
MYGLASLKGISAEAAVFKTQTMKMENETTSRKSREPGLTLPRGSGEKTRRAAVSI